MIVYEIKSLIWAQQCLLGSDDHTANNNSRLVAALRRMEGSAKQLTKLFRNRNHAELVDVESLLLAE